MLQAAACHEVSMACPLSVCDKSEQGARKEEESEEEKTQIGCSTSWLSKETGIKGWRGDGGLHIKKPNCLKAEHVSCMLWHQGLVKSKEAKE